MHKLAEKIAECLKAKVEGMGIDNIQGADLEELGKWTDIIKDIAEYDQAMRIIEAMDESEDDDEERRYYRGRSRTTGRYVSRRGRRGYEEPMYQMTADMFHEHDPEYYRDMDRQSGKMYYSGGSGSGSSSGGAGGGQSGGMSGGSGGSRGYSEGGRDGREGRSGQSRRTYMETKEMHKGNSPEEKQKKMKELEKYMGELGSDITEMISDASPEEKNLLKAKMQTLMQKF